MGLPSGTQYCIPVVVNAAKIAGAITYYPYQIDLSVKLAADAVFKSHIASAANIAVYDPVEDSARPRLAMLDLSNNKLLLSFGSYAITSANKTFYVCVGSGVSQVDSTAVFGVPGYSNRWSFNEFSGASVADSVGSLTGTINSPAALAGGKFGNCIANTTGNVNFGVVSGMVNKSTLSIECMFKVPSNTVTGFIYNKQQAASARISLYMDGAGNMRVYFANGIDSSGRFAMSPYAAGQWHHFMAVFDGSQGTDATRLKVVVDGAAVTLSFVGTIPATTDVYNQPLSIGYTSTPAECSCDELGIIPAVKDIIYAQTRYNQFFDAGFFTVGSGYSVGGSQPNKLPTSPRGYGYAKRY
jgi:Concanavalin A-like lectin/glucanases superfamily